jgi:hypothetical protein
MKQSADETASSAIRFGLCACALRGQKILNLVVRRRVPWKDAAHILLVAANLTMTQERKYQ